MKNIETSNIPSLIKLYKDLKAIYTLTEIEQEALDLCRENEKDCTHIIVITDIILDKLKLTLKDLETLTKNCTIIKEPEGL